MREDNIRMLQETLQILERGGYEVNGKRVRLKLSKKEMEEIRVLLPQDVEEICGRTDFKKVFVIGRCGFGCENMDSFALARKRYEQLSYMFNEKDPQPILVLNLANPVNPGGGVRRGARAQEEDLCRESSLLLSLESRAAAPYYEYNRNLHTYMGSDAMMFTPKVEIIRDENGDFLDETVIVSVLTCAAPMVSHGKEGMSEQEYQAMVYNRITGMLKCAAYLKYKVLILGAWGCGAFGNDAKVISDLFYRALKEMRFNDLSEKDFFRRIDFAVLDRTPQQYNFKEFYRNFTSDHYYRDENQAEWDAAAERIRKAETHLDRIQGCLFGGAVGDALGYPIEFMSEKEIFSLCGDQGLRAYQLDRNSGKALISDDTQMTLFTANGLLMGITRGMMRGIGADPHSYVMYAYRDWLRTQEMSFEKARAQLGAGGIMNGSVSWLCDVPELYSCRAPGNTCMSALYAIREGGEAQNSSKGCGGVMRVAPMGLINWAMPIRGIDEEGAKIAAITHKHSLGYMPAAVLTHIISRLVYPEKDGPAAAQQAQAAHPGGETPQTEAARQAQAPNLKQIVLEARDTVASIYADDAHIKELTDIIDRAVRLSENDRPDLENIHQLGEGWVAEETLAIAVYCALRHQDDFSAGVIAAVNHRGDSDSTGAVTGNILGALLGYEAIEEKWKRDLELSDVILEMAGDLCRGCQMSEYGHYRDPDWERKYMEMRWKDENAAAPGVPAVKFEAVKGDITKDHGVAAIVNAANNSLLGGGGVDGAIHRAAGPKLLEECRKLHGCRTGEAKITGAYRLPCRNVIHTPGPIWNGGAAKEEELLASCYRSCMQLALDHGIRSIAFPSISTGAYGYPLAEAAGIAVRTVKQFTAEHPGAFDLVKWVLFDDETFRVYADELKRWEVSELVQSPTFYEINRILGEGGLA